MKESMNQVDAVIKERADGTRFIESEIPEREETSKDEAYLFRFRHIGHKVSWRSETVNALSTISKFNKTDLALLAYVDSNMLATNHLKIVRSKLSTSEKRTLSTGVTSWIKKGLLHRISREHFMINPHFIVPFKKKQATAKKEWEDLM